MKNKALFLFAVLSQFLFVNLSSAQLTLPVNPNRKIQIAILLDNSGSMQGLLDQAKSTIWQVVNSASKLTIDNEIPTLELAIYEYGDEPKQYTNFTTDLDSISEILFGIPVRGGDEYCGQIIQKAGNELTWTTDPKDLHIIYIAGNEPFNQGTIDYKTVIPQVCKKNIIVNTIFCGDYMEGVRTFWQDGAQLCQGNYFNIDSNADAFHVDTPYDKEIIQWNDSLNTTYMGYGSYGLMREQKQVAEDEKNTTNGSSYMADRAASKSKAYYKNDNWDLVDKNQQDSTFVQKKLKDEELPAELKGKTQEEQKKILDEKFEERKVFQAKINELTVKREAFIAEEKKKMAETNGKKDLGSSMVDAMNKKAVSNGYKLIENK
jgi:hypothetical protein